MRALQAALVVGICASVVACSSDQHLDVTIHWSEAKQTIDGFGASSAFFGESITDAVADPSCSTQRRASASACCAR